MDLGTTGTADYYEPVVISATDYFPFGMDMPGRTYQAGDYRFGFNGKEKDQNEEWGDLTHYDYGFRIYNPGIGRFLSVDPLRTGYPMLTPYQFASNSPIMNIDLDGLEAKPSIRGNEYEGKPASTNTYWSEEYEKTNWFWHAGGLDGYEAGWYNEHQYESIITEVGKNIGRELGFYEKYGSNSDITLQELSLPDCNCTEFRSPIDKLLGVGFDSPEWEARFGSTITDGVDQGYADFWHDSDDSVDPSYPIFNGITALQGSFVWRGGFNKIVSKRLTHLGAAGKGFHGIRITANGGPNFAGTKYLYKTGPGQKNIVKIKLTGSRYGDFKAANKLAGFKGAKAPKGYTWHHIDDFNPNTGESTMQLIRQDAHRATYPHKGSVFQYEQHFKLKYK